MTPNVPEPAPPVKSFSLPFIDPTNLDSFPVMSTLDQSSEANRLKLLSIIEGPAQKGADHLGGVIALSDYIIHQVDLTDEETGEMFPAARTLLLQPEGPPIEFVSVGVLKSLQRIATMMKRLPPYDPPIAVRVTQVSTRGGRRTFKLVPVLEEA